jgi:DNA polymerase-4
MTLPEALRYSRRALVLPLDPVLCARADEALAGIMGRFSPLVEPAGGGRLYAELTGTRRLLGEARNVAHRAQAEIREALGLGPSAGVGINKLVCGVATRVAAPVALLDIAPGQEAGFLAPLPVRHLPAVDPRTEGRLLEDLSIRTVAHLRQVALPHLGMAFGSRALALYRQSRGLDDAPVRPLEKAPVAEADETLAEDTNDDALLRGCLFALVERCGARLRQLGVAARRAVLAARYSDGVMASRGLTLPSPEARDLTLFRLLRPLFEIVVGRRSRVRYLRLRLEDLAAPSTQMQLFDDEDPQGVDHERSLMSALDRIRKRFGSSAVRFGRSDAGGPPGTSSRRHACARPRAVLGSALAHRRRPATTSRLAHEGLL